MCISLFFFNFQPSFLYIFSFFFFPSLTGTSFLPSTEFFFFHLLSFLPFIILFFLISFLLILFLLSSLHLWAHWFVGRLVDRSVGWSVIISWNGGKFHFQYSYRSTCIQHSFSLKFSYWRMHFASQQNLSNSYVLLFVCLFLFCQIPAPALPKIRSTNQGIRAGISKYLVRTYIRSRT